MFWARAPDASLNAPEIFAVAVEEKAPSKVPDNDPVSETEVADILLVPPMNDSEPEIEGLSILIILWFCLYV
jgi:tRNA (Thr-GGU) A37 N-methylase